MSVEGLSPQILDPGGLDILDVHECWRLAATQTVGRLAVIMGQYPLVFPVNYGLDDETIIFRTAPGTKLGALHHSNVTFQIDVVSPGGWSVMIRGVAHEMIPQLHPELAERSLRAGAIPWAPGEREHIVRITPDHVTGRRIRLAEIPAPFDLRGYL